MLSRTSEYAIRALILLAGAPDAAATAGDIARRTHVPRGYLSKVMRSLVVAGLVVSHRGRRGGFALARHPRAITVLEVVNAVEAVRRVRPAPAETAPGPTRPLRRGVNSAIDGLESVFRTMTLDALAAADGTCSAA